jgi:hypothetical protein
MPDGDTKPPMLVIEAELSASLSSIPNMFGVKELVVLVGDGKTLLFRENRGISKWRIMAENEF